MAIVVYNPDGTIAGCSTHTTPTVTVYNPDGTIATTGCGSQGTQSTQGLQGNQGLQGTQGNQGLQGTQGLQGIQGIQGAGTVGTQGIQGPQGAYGGFCEKIILFNNSTFLSFSVDYTGCDGLLYTSGISPLSYLEFCHWSSTPITYGPGGSSWIIVDQATFCEGPTGAQGLRGYQGIQGIQGIQGVQGLQGVQGITGPVGAGGTISYYGAFYDTTDQTAALINTGYAFKLNTTAMSNGVSITNNGSGDPTRITFANIGKYNLQFSAQLHNTGGGGAGNTVDIWFRKGGVDIADSNTKVTVPSNNPYVVAAWDFMLDITAANQYYELMWATDNTSIIAEYETSSAVHPAIPSIIVDVIPVVYAIQGTQGVQGVQGIQGLQGIQGIIGSTGAQGSTGANGSAGAQGAQGIQGVQGVQGLQGRQGTTGSTGSTGSQGATGSQGTTGSTGAQGTQGIQGIQGRQGTQGNQGLQGQAGTSQGTQGIQGRQGIQGLQGISLQGFQGIQGADGSGGGGGSTLQRTLFVDPSGSSLGVVGNIAQPWASLSSAADYILSNNLDNHSIHVFCGLYYEIKPLIDSGTQSADITINIFLEPGVYIEYSDSADYIQLGNNYLLNLNIFGSGNHGKNSIINIKNNGSGIGLFINGQTNYRKNITISHVYIQHRELQGSDEIIKLTNGSDGSLNLYFESCTFNLTSGAADVRLLSLPDYTTYTSYVVFRSCNFFFNVYDRAIIKLDNFASEGLRHHLEIHDCEFSNKADLVGSACYISSSTGNEVLLDDSRFWAGTADMQLLNGNGTFFILGTCFTNGYTTVYPGTIDLCGYIINDCSFPPPFEFQI